MMQQTEKTLLLVSRENPALPVRCRDARNLASRLVAAAWAAGLSDQELALALLNERSEIPYLPHDVLWLVQGSGRRYANDGGGHYGWALRRAQERLRPGDPAALYRAEERGRLLRLAFPRLAEAADEAIRYVILTADVAADEAIRFSKPLLDQARSIQDRLIALCEEAINKGEAEVIEPQPVATTTVELDGQTVELGLLE